MIPDDSVVAPVLVYDGVCALCNRAVQFVIRHDRTIRFAPLQGMYAAGLMERHAELRTIDSIILVTRSDDRETIRTKSDAALAILAHIGWPRSLVGFLSIIPRPIRDFLYDVVARTRYRAFGRLSSCPMPAPDMRHRFIA